jgi:hypothetical protein
VMYIFGTKHTQPRRNEPVGVVRIMMSRGGGIIGRAGIKPTVLPTPSRKLVLGILAANSRANEHSGSGDWMLFSMFLERRT